MAAQSRILLICSENLKFHCSYEVCCALGYGFKNVALISDYAACHPHALPNKKYGYGEPKDRDWADKPVAAVVVVETPQDWHEDLQVICDLLR